MQDGIVKTDISTGTVLLSVVLDGTVEKCYLLCLSARTTTKMVRAEIEFAVGLGFHGIHLAKAE